MQSLAFPQTRDVALFDCSVAVPVTAEFRLCGVVHDETMCILLVLAPLSHGFPVEAQSVHSPTSLHCGFRHGNAQFPVARRLYDVWFRVLGVCCFFKNADNASDFIPVLSIKHQRETWWCLIASSVLLTLRLRSSLPRRRYLPEHR